MKFNSNPVIKNRPWTYFIFVFFFTGIECLAQLQASVGLIGDFTPGAFSSEMDSARSYLYSTIGREKTAVFEIQKIRKKVTEFSRYQILWFHRPDSAMLTVSEQDPRFTTALVEYVRDGGILILTLDALRTLPLLGLETSLPEAGYIHAADEGYGRKCGLHAYRYHPVFDSLNGGAYLYEPPSDRWVRQMGWFGQNGPAGKTIAVDWAYIFLKENSKLMVEYTLGKGKVLAIGAYTWFGPENMKQDHLRIFMGNCFQYLLGPVSIDQQYWTYNPVKVRAPEPEPDTVLLYPSEPWIESRDQMLRRKYPKNEPFDVAGERILVMGKENGGIDEIWSHPFMALYDYETGLLTGNSDSILWLNELKPEIEVTPYSFKRIYRFRRSYLEEIISSHPTDPLVAIHYEYRGITDVRLVLRMKSNLRFMWPYSEQVTGTITCEWHNGIQALRMEDLRNGFAVVTGTNRKPFYQAIGHYEQFDLVPGMNEKSSGIIADSIILATKTEKHQLAGIMVFDLKANDRFDLVVSASTNGKKDATDIYRKAIPKPYWVYLTAQRNHQKKVQQQLAVRSPDKAFNDGFQWAMSGTEKFMIHTPGIGRSLAAGYATTGYGWDGGHLINGRPGYAWYFGRDGVWSGYALLQAGDFENVRSILELFIRYQDPGGKIFHELTTSGVVHYDAADATPLFLSLAGRYLRSTGDTTFIQAQWNAIHKALSYCYSTDTDGDGLIENTLVGHGWEEGGLLFGTHTTLYLASCWADALKQTAYMANILGFRTVALKLSKDEGNVLQKIRTEFWNPELSFFFHGKYKNGSFHPEPAVMASIPLLYGQVNDSSHWKSVLKTLASNEFSTDWGVRILSENSPGFRPGSYHQGSVWPLFTGWTSLAEYKHGQSVQAFSHLMNNLLTYRTWALGFIPEVIHGSEYKPFGVCSHQCWSETMVLQPAIEGMLGIERDAIENTITLSPQVPFDWDSLEIRNIRLGQSYINASLKETPSLTTWLIEPSDNNSKPVQVYLNLRFPPGTRIHRILLDGQEIESDQSKKQPFVRLTTDRKRVVEVFKSPGISVLPSYQTPREGSYSDGIRIIEEELKGKSYMVTVRGRSGTKGSVRVYYPQAPALSILKQEEPDVYSLQFQLAPADSKYTSMKLQIPFK